MAQQVNLEGLSDDELDKFIASRSNKQPTTEQDLNKMSDEDLNQFIAEKMFPKEDSLTKNHLDSIEKSSKESVPWYTVRPEMLVPGFVKGLQKIDEYTGAPLRKFVTEQISGKSLDKAPSGSEQAAMMGAPTQSYKERFGLPESLGGNFSPADVYGVGLELVQDPLLVGGAALKGVKGLVSGLPKAAETIGSFGRAKSVATGTQEGSASARSAAKSGASVSGGGISVEQGGKLFEIKPPQSLEELRSWKPPQNAGQLPSFERMKQIEQIVPDLSIKPLNYHYDMLSNPKKMKELKIQFENLPTKDAQQIAAYNYEMLNESEKKVKSLVNEISGAEPKSLPDSGSDLINTVKDKYSAEKEALGPIFQDLKKSNTQISPQESADLIYQIGENSKVGKLLEVDQTTGKFKLKNNTPRTGVSDQEHKIISRLVDDLNDGMTFEEIQNAREFLRKGIDPANPKVTEEISKVRSVLLGQLENLAGKYGPQVKDTFKRYAINERTRESIEQIIGGKIESLDAMYSANPDKVVGKIFSNPNHAEIVKSYVGPEKFSEMVQAYVNNGISKSFDSTKGFLPHNLKSWVAKNDAFLNAYLPETKERLSALADYGFMARRFLDEVNPSGTAASLAGMLSPKSFFQKVAQEGVVSAATSEATGLVRGKLKQRQAVGALSDALSGVQKTPSTDFSSMFNKDPNLKRLIEIQTGQALGRGLLKDDNQSAIERRMNKLKEGK